MFSRKIMSLLIITIILAASIPLAVLAQDQTSPDGQPEFDPTTLFVAPDLFSRAFNASGRQDHEQAIVNISLFIMLNPTVVDAYRLRADSYLQSGEADLALIDYERALNLIEDPQQTSLLQSEIARVHLMNEDVETALNVIDSSIEDFPDNPENYWLRGNIYNDMERFDEALDAYNEVVRLAPDFAAVYIQRGVINSVANNDLDSAEEDFSTAIELDPGNPDAYFRRSFVYIDREDFQSALSDLNVAIDIAPDFNTLYFMRGLVNQALMNEVSAADDYYEWININAQRAVQGEMLAANQTITLSMEPGLVYQIPFEAQAGESFDVQADSAQAPPLLVILDVEGKPLIASTDSDTSFNTSVVSYRLPKSGLYTLVVSHAFVPIEGDVTVSRT